MLTDPKPRSRNRRDAASTSLPAIHRGELSELSRSNFFEAPSQESFLQVAEVGPVPDRPSAAAVDGVRDGAELLAPDLSALLPGRPNGELPARPCRRLRRVAWRSACSPL